MTRSKWRTFFYPCHLNKIGNIEASCHFLSSKKTRRKSFFWQVIAMFIVLVSFLYLGKIDYGWIEFYCRLSRSKPRY